MQKALVDGFEPIVGAPMVMDHHAALQLGHGRAGLVSAIERMGQRRGGMQPTGRSGDAQAGFVEAAHARRRDACADGAIERLQRFGLAANPTRHARAADPRRPEQVVKHLGGSFSGTSCWALRVTAAAFNRSPY